MPPRQSGSVLIGDGDEKKNVQIVGALELVSGRGTPHWLELNSDTVTGRVLGLPKREDINLPIQERMIVELYSK